MTEEAGRDHMRPSVAKQGGDVLLDLKQSVKELERRMRSIESNEINQMRKSLYMIENQISNLKASNESSREKWKIALNFAVQLVWVVMAAYLLHRLGIDMGPL